MKIMSNVNTIQPEDTVLQPHEHVPRWDGSGEQLELPFPPQQSDDLTSNGGSEGMHSLVSTGSSSLLR